MKKIFTLAAIALFTITSCSDNDSDSTTTPTPGDSAILLKKAIITDEDEEYTKTFTYDGNKLTDIVNSDGTYEHLTYTGDLITGWDSYYEDGTLSQKDIYEYGSDGKLSTFYWLDYELNTYTKYLYTHNTDGTISYSLYVRTDEVNYEFDLDGKIYPNKAEENIVGNGSQPTQVYAYNYTFDDKNSPFKNVTGYGKISFTGTDEGTNFENNITSMVATSTTGTTQTLSTTTYTYNSDNFPITSSVIYNSDNFEETQYFYE